MARLPAYGDDDCPGGYQLASRRLAPCRALQAVTATEGARPAGTLSSETADQVPSTTEGKRVRVPAIDGFRGYAAIAVLLFHVSYAAGRPPLDEGIIRSVLISGSWASTSSS